jgi:hypothetical protein
MMEALSPGTSGQNLCERIPNFPRVVSVDIVPVDGTSPSFHPPLHRFAAMLFFLETVKMTSDECCDDVW